MAHIIYQGQIRDFLLSKKPPEMTNEVYGEQLKKLAEPTKAALARLSVRIPSDGDTVEFL